jgi:ABC-type nitrate/sulfonate/bicarbonate transport system substrate-binding protein
VGDGFSLSLRFAAPGVSTQGAAVNKRSFFMRKSNVKFASLFMAGALTATLAVPSQAQEVKLALGMSGWTGFAPLTLADKAGLFKKHGLEVDLKMIPQKDRHLALASNAVQCAATTVETHVAWNLCPTHSVLVPNASCVATVRPLT